MVEQLPTFGTVVGWGLTEKNVTSDELLMANLKYINFTKCRDKISSEFSFFVTSDKFCAGLDNGTAVQRGDSGGGITFPRNTNDNKVQYYLYGIVSLKDSSRNNIAAFTDIRKHLHWLNITLISIINPALFDPGCPLLPSNSVTLAHCSLNGTSIDCNTGARPGTKAKLLCKSSYHDGSPFKLYTETECSAELKWLPLPESCIDCGKRHQFNQIRPLVKFKPRTVSEYPWHVGIYRKLNLEMRMICGGTIIHPKAVITVAHCVTDQHALKNLDVTKLFVAAGKFKSSWNEPEPAVQKFQVKKIYIKDSYKGRDLFFRDDIAILELNGTINLSDYIMPVCIDWSEKLDLFRNPLISGTTSGWGYTEDQEISSELRSSKLHYSDRLPCMKLVSNTRLITPDKFCGISLEGSIPSAGDSGGALTFPHYNAEIGEELNYLYGLVSTKGSEDVVTLTNVTYHLDWIKTILLSIINNSGT